MYARIMGSLALAALVAALGGCFGHDDDPIAGSWESVDTVANEHNTLDVTARSGDSRLYFYYNNTPYYADFDVDVNKDGSKHYLLDYACQGDCATLDFTMDCDVVGDRMYCNGDGAWTTYDFSWRRP